MNIFTQASHIMFLKKGSSDVAAKKDLKTVVDYISARLNAELNRTRFNQKTGAKFDFSDDAALMQASDIVNSVLNDIAEINKRTDLQKKAALKKKNMLNATLSPDESYAIDMTALKDIKKAGLKRLLSKDETQTLKNATQYVNVLYSEHVKMYKEKERTRGR